MGMAEASFRQLAAFVAGAREESFSAAADELRYGQATVSQQVAALEKHIGARLFERPGGPKSISLTPLGRVLLPQAQHILEHVTNVELDIRDVASGAAGRIKIGTFQSVAVHLLPAAARMRLDHARALLLLVRALAGPPLRPLTPDRVDGLVRVEGTQLDLRSQRRAPSRLRALQQLQRCSLSLLRGDSRPRNALIVSVRARQSPRRARPVGRLLAHCVRRRATLPSGRARGPGPRRGRERVVAQGGAGEGEGCVFDRGLLNSENGLALVEQRDAAAGALAKFDGAEVDTDLGQGRGHRFGCQALALQRYTQGVKVG